MGSSRARERAWGEEHTPKALSCRADERFAHGAGRRAECWLWDGRQHRRERAGRDELYVTGEGADACVRSRRRERALYANIDGFRQLVDATTSGGEGTGKTTELKTKGTFTHRGLAVPASTAGPGVIGAMAGVTAVLTALAAFRYLTTRTFKPATHLAPTKSGSYEADESSVAIETEKLHHRRQSRTSDDTVTD